MPGLRVHGFKGSFPHFRLAGAVQRRFVHRPARALVAQGQRPPLSPQWPVAGWLPDHRDRQQYDANCYRFYLAKNGYRYCAGCFYNQ
jgi:hypothetical protein